MRCVVLIAAFVLCCSRWTGPRAATAHTTAASTADITDTTHITAHTTGTAVAESPLIATLRGRNQIIAIRAGAYEPVFSVQSRDGAVLAHNMTLSQLAQQKPDTARAVQRLQASAMWAGVDE
jgi:hypothetical protein